LSVGEITQLSDWLPGYADYEVELSWREKRHFGRGIAKTANKALEIAITEAFERCLVFSSGLVNSNGVAAHTTLADATHNAKMELIERDLFLCHYYTETPMRIFEYKPSAIGKLAKMGVKMDFWLTHSFGSQYCIAAIASGFDFSTPFGAIVGLGTGEDKEAAAEKAFVECLRMTVSVINQKKIQSISALELAGKTKPSVMDQFNWALSLEARNGLRAVCRQESQGIKNVELGCDAFFNVTTLFKPSDPLDPPLFVMHAENPRLQPLYFGVPMPSTVNIQRLTESRIIQ